LPFADFEQLQGKYKCSYAEWNEKSRRERGREGTKNLCATLLP